MEGFGGVERAGETSGDSWSRSEIAVDVEELFSARVVGFHVGVGDGPGGGDASLMLDDAEVFGTHAEESSAIDLGLAADVIGLLRMEWLVVFVVPCFCGVIAVVEKDCRGVPVEFFLGKEGTTLQDEDALAGACEV